MLSALYEDKGSAKNENIMAGKKRNKTKKHIILDVFADGDTMEKVVRMLQVLVDITSGGVSYQVVNKEATQQEPQQEKQQKAVRPMPRELDTPKARKVLDGLVGIKVLDANYQPQGLSWTLRSFLAYHISVKVGFTNVWKVFSEFWGMNAGTLKARYNEALKIDSMANFYNTIKPFVG